MTIFLLVFGFMLTVVLPMLAIMYIVPHVEPQDWKASAPMLLAMPGCVMVGIGFHSYAQKPVDIYQACGKVQFYKTYSVKRDHFERIAIKFDGSKYNRHLRFEEYLVRKQKGEHICFEYYDKFKNKNLGESKILKWIEPTSIQQ